MFNLKNFPSFYIIGKNKGNFKKSFRDISAYKKIKKTNLFDEKFYLKKYPDVENFPNPLLHYMFFGYKEGRQPSSNFDGYFYLNKYNDVKKSNLNPLVHYILYGEMENRKILNSESQKPRKTRYTFSDFSGFLANSYVSPLIKKPFFEEEKRCFAVMDNIAKYLVRKTQTLQNFPLVSVILYNDNPNKLLDIIENVSNQSYPNIELIAIINFEEKLEGTVLDKDEIISNVHRSSNIDLVFIKNKSEVGNAKSYNLAIEKAKGEYITYMDDSHKWDLKFIETMIGGFLKIPEAEVLYSGNYLFKKSEKKPYGVKFGSLNKSLLVNNNFIDFCSICHKKETYIDLGGMDENFKIFYDYDLLIRMSEKAKMYSVPILLSSSYENDLINHFDKDYLKKEKDLIFEKRQIRVKNNFNKYIKDNIPLEKKVSVIIPSYEALLDLKECINSILDLNLGDLLEIIVVDNDSSKDVKDYLNFLNKINSIKLIQNDYNYGFTFAVNQGIEVSDYNSDILILNNDAVLTPGAINHLQDNAYRLKNCGITVPQQILPKGKKGIKHHVPYATIDQECDVTPSAIHENIENVPLLHNGKFLELSFAPFFCAYIKRDVLNNSVGFDAELGRHYRSDRIFSYFLKHVMNLKIYHISDSVVYHKHKQATRYLKDKEKEFNLMFTKNKWEEDLGEKLGYKNPIWD